MDGFTGIKVDLRDRTGKVRSYRHTLDSLHTAYHVHGRRPLVALGHDGGNRLRRWLEPGRGMHRRLNLTVFVKSQGRQQQHDDGQHEHHSLRHNPPLNRTPSLATTTIDVQVSSAYLLIGTSMIRFRIRA